MKDFVDGTASITSKATVHANSSQLSYWLRSTMLSPMTRSMEMAPEQIARWARSRDGREVLSCAGIDPNERVVTGLMDFVGKGVRTSVALSREESERRNAAAQQAEAA